jgi:hypothetical protein
MRDRIAVRVRQLAAVAVAAACLAGLTACRSNVGTAATLNGHRITEKDVTRYFTPAASQVPEQDSTTGSVTCIAPRTWVLRTLLSDELYTELITKAGNGQRPSAADLVAAQQQLLQGTPVSDVVKQYVSHGYQASFAPVYLHEQSLEQILRAEIQSGLDARKVLDEVGVHVSVNPRYGSWDPRNFQLGGSPTGGVPSFLTLAPNYQPPDLGGAATASTSTCQAGA